MTLRLNYGQHSALDLSYAFVVINGSLPITVTAATAATPTTAAGAVDSATAAPLTSKAIGLGNYRTQDTTQDRVHHTLVVSASLSTPSSSFSWNTNSAISVFGKPDPYSVDLSGGALTASIPIDVPAGPGGLTTPLSLSYSSAGVSEQHSPQGAASWVGEGWNLSMGEITWTEKNYTSYCTAPGNSCANTWENTWQLSDPFGTSSELIPPNNTVSTYYDDTPNIYVNGSTYPNIPVTWHTARETYAKVIEYLGPIDLGNHVPPPCFRVWLKNGIMEEFGCTFDSLVTYIVNPNNVAQDYVSGWLLDMVTDPQGNQIHFTYQQDQETKYGLTYPRDTALAKIEWDSPGCHNAQTMCTGSSWAPLMRVQFVAGHTIPASRLTNSPSGCNTGANYRCDDPVDLSGSNGLASPEVQSTFVLTDINVQVNNSTSGGGSYNGTTWNTLKSYQLSYEQTGPVTIPDPATGKSESVAGSLDLTKFQEVGTDLNPQTGLPARIFGYTTYDEHYEDAVYRPNPSTNCGPTWNTGTGTGCILWSTTYAGNDRYLASASNGLGLQQTFTYVEARNNTHGVNGGGATNTPNPVYCNAPSIQSTYPCNAADDQNWSRVVLQQRQELVQRISQNGQGGQQTTTTVKSTTQYQYSLTYPLLANWCGDCVAGMYWGDQKDGDYLDYYNGVFMGFAQAQVAQPDGSVEVHKFYATEGYGLYNTSKVTCNRSNPSQCNNAPWWDLTNAAHGHEYEADYYDTNGSTLLKKTSTQYHAICPPGGVSGTGTVSGYGDFDGKLVAELDLANPVAVCDVQTTRTDSYTYDGSSASGAPDATTTYTYDGDSAHYGRVTSLSTTSNNGGATGSPTSIVNTTNYIWNDAVTTTQTSASGKYLIDFAAFNDTEDSSGIRYHCTYRSYDGQGWVKGQQSGLAMGEETTDDKYSSSCGTAANNWTPSGLIETKQTYDQWGNQISSTDPDANSGNNNHIGCAIGSAQYTSCDAFDSTFDVLPTTSTNALKQTNTIGYGSQPAASTGFGLWPLSTTDVNGQTTSYAYDALARMTSETLPGEGTGLTTVSWTYTNWCLATSAQSPCLEIDQIQRLNSSTMVTSRGFYDGYGQLVETRNPAPGGQDVVRYRNYDASGRDVFDSNSYFVTAYTGSAGSAAFSIPDSTQPGTKHADITWYGYDGLSRAIKVQDALSNTTTTSYTVVCNAPGTGDSACYEQTLTVDALGHQSGALTDALRRGTYDQSYTGNSPATYAVYTTTQYAYEYVGNLIKILHPDGTTKSSFQYDFAGRKTGMVDPDRGTESYSYDADGNLIQMADARGNAGTTYAGYDGLDRQLWRNTTNSSTGAYVTYSYDGTTSPPGTSAPNYGIGRRTGQTFTGGPNASITGSYRTYYDGRGQIYQTDQIVGSTTYTTKQAYNDNAQPTSTTYPDGELITVDYSSAGTPQDLQSTINGTSTFIISSATYAASGDLSGLGYGGSPTSPTFTQSFAYDLDRRLSDQKSMLAGTTTPFYELTLGYDAASHVVSAATTLPAVGSNPAGTDYQGFCYDEQNRLVWASTTGTPTGPAAGSCGPAPQASTLNGGGYTQTFAYDVLGRMTTGAKGTYTYGDPAHIHAPTSTSGGHGYAYDAAGNSTCVTYSGASQCTATLQTGPQLTFDNEGRLTNWQNSPSSPSSTDVFAYDGAGQRVEQQAVQSGTTTTWIYVGGLAEYKTTSSGTSLYKYYSFGGRLVAGRQNALHYFLTDQVGSIQVEATISGGAEGASLRKPFGQTRYGSVSFLFKGFTGQLKDDVPDLVYFNARYYDQDAAVFISADTVADGLNRYAYVHDNPETGIDPTGHCWPLCTILAGAAIGMGIAYGMQVYANMQRGDSFLTALGDHIDGNTIIAGGLIGAAAGLTLGAGVPVAAGLLAEEGTAGAALVAGGTATYTFALYGVGPATAVDTVVEDATEEDMLAVRQFRTINEVTSRGRNAGFVDPHVDGKSLPRLAAFSGGTPNNTTAGPIGDDPVFEPIEWSAPGQRPYLRSGCAECKLLNAIAKDLSPSDTGYVDLVTEHDPCGSCQQLFPQWNAQFPSIELKVRSGRLLW